MKALVRLAALAVALVLAFGYGLAAGTYHIFPFYQIADLKDRLAGGATQDRALPGATGVEVRETALQRLLLRYVALPAPTGTEFVEGGAMAGAGSVLYLVNRDGGVLAYDVARPARLEAAVPAAPINVGDFAASRARHSVARAWFRVSGAHAEQASDGTHTLFVAHNRLESDPECFTYNISRITLSRSGDRVEAVGPWRTIFTTRPCMELQPGSGHGRYPFAGHISGGKMISFDDVRLLATVGDFNFDGYLRPAFSMDPDTPHGKYVLVDKESGSWEAYAIGARNNLGLFRDEGGVIWATESGPQGGDELNRVVAGANFGWPETTYGINYENAPWEANAAQGRHGGYDPPVFAWNPSVVPSNLVRFPEAPPRFALWSGDLLLGSLRDQSLHRLRLDLDGRVVYDERIPFGERIRDLVMLPDGKVALLTDVTGWLVIVEDGGGIFEGIGEEVRARMAALEAFGALDDERPRARGTDVSAASTFQRSCASCHEIDGGIRTAPPLAGILDRGIGAYPGFTYSYGLATASRRWTADELRSFLLDPQGAFPGTSMPSPALSVAEVDSVVAYLSSSEHGSGSEP